MRKYITSFGEVVDLDDPETYSGLPDEISVLRKLIFEKIGYSYCYMNHWYRDIYNNSSQKSDVENMITYFTQNELQNSNNVMWYKEQVFRFEDEIENMC